MLLAKKNKNKIIESRGDRVLHAITTMFLLAILILVGYPVLYVVSCSFSSAQALSSGRVLLWPVEPSLAGYEFILHYKVIWIGYRNTILYTVVGVTLCMIMQTICAYPLSRPHYQGRRGIMFYYFLTTMVGAGLIPTFIVKANILGLYNSMWAVFTTGIVGVSNVIILRTALQGVPAELYDAAAIDGANDFQTMIQVALPLVKATLSVLVLYAAVGCWNDYFNAMIYLQDDNKYPLQLFLRTILTAAQSFDTEGMEQTLAQQVDNGTEQIQYTLIVISTVPVLLMYFAVQSSFKKGVMIGSVKG